MTGNHSSRTSTGGTRLAVAAALVAAGAVTGALLLRRDTADVALVPNRLVVAPFATPDGDTALAPLAVLAADRIAQGLPQDGALQVVPVTAALGAARLAPDSTDGDPVARLAHETGAGWVVSGAVVPQGDSLLSLQATVTEVRRGRVAASLGPMVVARDSAVVALDRLRAGVASALGAAAGSPGATPSLAAYMEHARGLDRFVAGDIAGAREHFVGAAEADTAWAPPVLMAALASGELGELRRMEVLVRRVAAMRGTLAPHDAATLDGLEAWVHGDRAAAYAAARRAAALAPNTIAAERVGAEALALGRPREAVRVLDSLDATRGELRGFLPYWTHLTTAYHLLGEHTEELYAASRARALHPDSDATLALELRAMAALGQCNRVSSRLDTGGGSLGAREIAQLARECMAHGDSLTGGILAERALGAARATVARTPTPQNASALVEALAVTGRWADAAALADSLLGMVPDDTELRGRRGVLAVRLGDGTTARLADAGLARPGLPDWGRDAQWRARIAAATGDEVATIALLEQAAKEGMGLDQPFHADLDLLPARTKPRFVDWLRPKE